MKKDFEFEERFISLNGYQMNTLRGGDDPEEGDDGGEEGGDGVTKPGHGDCDRNLHGSQHCTTVYGGPGGTDNVCGTCPFHKNG